MSQVGNTSSEIVVRDGKIVRPKLTTGFNFYHSLLAISAVFITIASLLLFFELRKWGPFPGMPWKTTQAKIEIPAE
jgi:hypothetical protein